jgi:uncharacterized protein
VLDVQLRRLSLLAHRLIWVNPRLAAEAYQPLTAGIAAALPHVDRFVSGHSPAAMEEVLAAVREGSRRRRPGLRRSRGRVPASAVPAARA